MIVHYRAAAVFPSSSEPIADGVVSVENGVITAVGPRNAVGHRAAETIDLGCAAIIPGLVNAHTHLDLSDLERPLGQPGVGMAEWLAMVIEHRQRATQHSRTARNAPAHGGRAEESVSPRRESVLSEHRWSSVRRGLSESAHYGVVALADVCSERWPAELASTHQIAALVCREMIAPTPQRAQQLCQAGDSMLTGKAEPAAEWLSSLADQQHALADSAPPIPGREHTAGDKAIAAERRIAAEGGSSDYQAGWSVHAPYTVMPELWPLVARNARRLGRPLAVHFAESAEEMEFLSTGGGPIRQLLEARGAWSKALRPRTMRPIDYLQMLDEAPRLLVIHGNYLDAESIDWLAQRRDRAAVVFCPRTHRWFGHRRYPLAEMLAHRVRLAVGTDSRASSPELNLWAELQTIAANYPEVSKAQVLALGTAEGAQALGLDRGDSSAHVGRLAVGSSARLTIIELPPLSGELFAWLFHPRSRPIGRILPNTDSAVG